MLLIIPMISKILVKLIIFGELTPKLVQYSVTTGLIPSYRPMRSSVTPSSVSSLIRPKNTVLRIQTELTTTIVPLINSPETNIAR